jgi:hypothetical protein
VSDQDGAAISLLSALTYRDVQSNVAARYKGPALAVALLQHRQAIPRSLLTVGDLGCSMNEGLTLMDMMPDPRVDYGKLTVLGVGRKKPRVDEAMTKVVDGLLQRSLGLKTAIGYDIVNPNNDPETQRWIRSCTFGYPRDWLDEQLVERYNLLAGTKRDNVKFVEADFSSSESMKGHLEGHDVLFALHSWYLLTMEQRLSTLDIAADKGVRFVVVQDYGMPDPVSPDGISLYNEWPDGSCNTMLYDLRDGSEPGRCNVEHLFNWNNGRCEQLRISRGIFEELREECSSQDFAGLWIPAQRRLA